MGRFFATLNHPNGGVVPLADHDAHGNETVAMFDSHAEAVAAVQENILGSAYGGRVYDTDNDGTDV